METRLQKEIESHPYPLLFATLSGAHLYGFPSPDSDYDLRGVHILPLEEVVGLKAISETLERAYIRDQMEMDMVTHDVRKFFKLMLKRNGYVLEQLYSPLILYTSPEHDELKHIARSCITRNHAHHYLGFAQNQWKLLNQETPQRVKPLLYLYRVLLTGIYLMQEGEVEANLLKLNEGFKLPYLHEMIECKVSGCEKETVSLDMAFHEKEYLRLIRQLEQARDSSLLPEEPSALDDLDALLVRIRLQHQGKLCTDQSE